jgi:hypothetical protein
MSDPAARARCIETSGQRDEKNVIGGGDNRPATLPALKRREPPRIGNQYLDHEDRPHNRQHDGAKPEQHAAQIRVVTGVPPPAAL